MGGDVLSHTFQSGAGLRATSVSSLVNRGMGVQIGRDLTHGLPS